MQKAIETKNLSVKVGKKTILSDISASIPAGKITGLLGPSGAGKTTLIKTLLGLQKVSKGQVSVLGRQPGDKTLRLKTGYVSQSPSIYPDLSVEKNIAYFAMLLGVGKQEVSSVIADVELAEYKKQPVGDLSGGQKARVSLAIALLGQPELLLLDEPTVGLDPVLRQKLWDKFRGLANEGVSIIISSHVMDEADKCDEIVFMREGGLLISGPKNNILKASKTRTLEEAFLKLAEGEEE